MKFNYEIEDFASSFGVEAETFSPSLVKEIKALDFSYRKPSEEEYDSFFGDFGAENKNVVLPTPTNL